VYPPGFAVCITFDLNIPYGVSMKHVPLKTVSIRLHPELNEKWVQEVIAADPAILGLGDLALIDKERTQPSGGRLDLLFKEVDGLIRYERSSATWYAPSLLDTLRSLVRSEQLHSSWCWKRRLWRTFIFAQQTRF
jgi:hypothetical protein